MKKLSRFVSALERAQMNNWLLLCPSFIAMLTMCYFYNRGLGFQLCVTVGIVVSILLYSAYIYLFVLLPESYYIGCAARDRYLSYLESGSNDSELLVPLEEEKSHGMSREEMIVQLKEIYSQMDDDKRQRIIQLATVYIFILNGLEDCVSDGPNSSPYRLCYSSAEFGWLAMSQRLSNDPDYEFDKEMFDVDTTCPYLEQMAREEKVTDGKLKELIRWSFNYGAQMRVDHGTLANYADSVLAGEIFDVIPLSTRQSLM